MTRSEAGRLGAIARNKARPEGRSREACRWAYENGSSLSEAARKFGVSAKTVSMTWAVLFPGLPAIRSRRATAVVNHPEDEVTC